MTTSAPANIRLGVDGRVLDDRYHGIGRITYELLERLAGRPNLSITLFLHPDQASGRFDIEALTARPGIDVAAFDRSLTSVTQFLAWPSALRRAGIDVGLFPYHLGAAVFGARRRYSIVHDCIFEENKRFAPDARTRILYLLLTQAVVRRTTVLTPSRASAAAVRHFHRVRVPDSHVVEWGVSSTFSAAPAAITSVNATPLPTRYYLHIGARRPHKNVEQLVRVLARLPAEEFLILVGSQDPRWPDPTMALARELGVADRIIQLGGVSESDLLALYRQATGYLYPSLVEGFGLPLLEAMAAGVPVIASDIPVFRELVEGAASLVPVADTDAWVGAIEQLQDPDRRQAMIEGGLRRAHEASWARAADRLAGILQTP